MNKPLLGVLLGGVLGVFDGLSALLSVPDVAPHIGGIIIGSVFKGLVAGLLIGVIARKLNSLSLGILCGSLIGLGLAFIVASFPDPETGKHYYWEIMLPGAMVGMIVGYATQRYGVRPRSADSLESR